MKVAVDTNDFIRLLSGNEELAPPARAVLERTSREAGFRYAAYARDRRKEGNGGQRRILADFLVGSHALLMAGANLLTSDTKIFANYFPELRMVTPADKLPKPEIQGGSDHYGDR